MIDYFVSDRGLYFDTKLRLEFLSECLNSDHRPVLLEIEDFYGVYSSRTKHSLQAALQISTSRLITCQLSKKISPLFWQIAMIRSTRRLPWHKPGSLIKAAQLSFPQKIHEIDCNFPRNPWFVSECKLLKKTLPDMIRKGASYQAIQDIELKYPRTV